jgi:cysteine-rich repeat protein
MNSELDSLGRSQAMVSTELMDSTVRCVRRNRAAILAAAIGLVCFVFGCASNVAVKYECGDGKDNDGDGLVDYPEDPDCISPSDDKEESTVPPGCGNGTVESDEVCDDGNNLDGDDCRSDCLQDLTLCGNGTLDPGEACDDGNRQGGDDCSADCGQDLTLCGNGEMDPGEICDDGNREDGDACSADCTQDLTLCGNGMLDPGEVCDDGLPPGQSVCSEDCTKCNGPCTDHTDCISCHECDSTGHCAMAEAGTDPQEECVEDPVESCGYTGSCDGAGACAFYGPEVACQEASCDGSTLTMARYCDGRGTCLAGGSVDCAPDECQLPSAPESGTACGSGEPVVLTHDATVFEEHTFVGNLLHSGGANWYRFGAVAAEGALGVYVWFVENPSEEFALRVEVGAGNVDDCSDGELQCAGKVPYTRFSYVFDQCDESCDELGRNVYVGVVRKEDAAPSCSSYTLRVRVGGTTPPW